MLRRTEIGLERQSAGASRTKEQLTGTKVARRDGRRMYYTSIAESRLYSKGRWWWIKTVNTQGTLIGEAWTDNRATAIQYISALEALREKAQNVK
jgi:hypothetical protein